MGEEQVERDRLRAAANPQKPFLVGGQPIGYVPPEKYPELGSPTILSEGIRLHTVGVYRKFPSKTDVRVYLPAKKAADRSLPAVFIAPAGSNCLCGMALAEGDTVEHLPYAKEGFAVVAFSLSGPMPDPPEERTMVKAVEEFFKADAGLHDGKAAIDFALTRVPEIDPNRLYAAGHSSAGTFALIFAAREPRIKAVAAYGAPIDMEVAFAPGMAQLRRAPEFMSIFPKLNPRANEQSLSCPVFLFHAADDDVVPISHAVDMEQRLKQAGKDVTFVRTPNGGHYDSMLHNGVPAAIRWFKTKAGLAK
jgi:acetyl esterase/lipase